MIVYKITNRNSGKSYIGQTKHSLNYRWSQHCNSNSKCTLISKAIKKNGKNSFSLEILGTYEDVKSLNEAEMYFIKTHDSLTPNGYNLKKGGHNGGNLSEESKEKIRLSRIGKRASDKTKLKMSESRKGEKHPLFGKQRSKEHCHNISVSLKNKATWMKGKRHTAESKEKMSESHKGHSPSKITREKLRNARKISVLPFKIKVLCVTNGIVYDSQSDAARELNLGVGNVNSVLKGRYESTGGYIFVYVDVHRNKK